MHGLKEAYSIVVTDFLLFCLLVDCALLAHQEIMWLAWLVLDVILTDITGMHYRGQHNMYTMLHVLLPLYTDYIWSIFMYILSRLGGFPAVQLPKQPLDVFLSTDFITLGTYWSFLISQEPSSKCWTRGPGSQCPWMPENFTFMNYFAVDKWEIHKMQLFSLVKT